MSDNTSATGGYIRDLPPGPISAEDIETALQAMASALSGLPGNMVRPRWQPTPPVQPDVSQTWASIGATMTEADEYPAIIHVGGTILPGQTNPGYSIMQRHQTLTVVVTFYGPNADGAASSLRDALYITQNWEPLLPQGIKLRTVHDLARVPEQINQQYIDRVDLRIEFRLQQNRIYPIFDLAGADVTITADSGIAREVEVRPVGSPAPAIRRGPPAR